MLDNEAVAKAAASFRREADKEFDKAVKALIALAFRYADAGTDFLWDMDPQLNAEAVRICRNLSDALAEKAKDIAAQVVKDALAVEMDERDWDAVLTSDEGEGEYYIPFLTRLDQQGSNLLELMEIWIALAFLYDLSQSELRVEISRYLSNPFLSRFWRNLPKGILKWGRGYSKDVRGQLEVIGQDAIVRATRLSEWRKEKDGGATYYIRRRGSSYDCDECDDACGYPIPIDVPFEWLHSRCMCWPEYHHEPFPTL